jgi:hypothetical protein
MVAVEETDEEATTTTATTTTMMTTDEKGPGLRHQRHRLGYASPVSSSSLT